MKPPKTLTIATDPGADQAVYVDGKLKYCGDSLVYAEEIVAVADYLPVVLRHVYVKEFDGDWPEAFSELTKDQQ